MPESLTDPTIILVSSSSKCNNGFELCPGNLGEAPSGPSSHLTTTQPYDFLLSQNDTEPKARTIDSSDADRAPDPKCGWSFYAPRVGAWERVTAVLVSKLGD